MNKPLNIILMNVHFEGHDGAGKTILCKLYDKVVTRQEKRSLSVYDTPQTVAHGGSALKTIYVDNPSSLTKYPTRYPQEGDRTDESPEDFYIDDQSQLERKRAMNIGKYILEQLAAGNEGPFLFTQVYDRYFMSTICYQAVKDGKVDPSVVAKIVQTYKINSLRNHLQWLFMDHLPANMINIHEYTVLHNIHCDTDVAIARMAKDGRMDDDTDRMNEDEKRAWIETCKRTYPFLSVNTGLFDRITHQYNNGFNNGNADLETWMSRLFRTDDARMRAKMQSKIIMLGSNFNPSLV